MVNEDSNVISVLTGVQSGVCVNDEFGALVKDLTNSTNSVASYITFDKDPAYTELNDMVVKDSLDKLNEFISDSKFLLVDNRLQETVFYSAIGFILAQWKTIGSFRILDNDIQAGVESLILLRKNHSGENKGTLKVAPNGYEGEEYVPLGTAIELLQKNFYDNIEFLEGSYNNNDPDLYILLSYGYCNKMKIFNFISFDSFTKVITSQC